RGHLERPRLTGLASLAARRGQSAGDGLAGPMADDGRMEHRAYGEADQVERGGHDGEVESHSANDPPEQVPLPAGPRRQVVGPVAEVALLGRAPAERRLAGDQRLVRVPAGYGEGAGDVRAAGHGGQEVRLVQLALLL